MAIDTVVIVGEYNEKFNTLLELSLPIIDIHIYPGLEKHINKRHEEYLPYIEKIELIKVFDENILISINLDVDKGYLYVSSLYDVKQGKIERRLNSGRLVRFE